MNPYRRAVRLCTLLWCCVSLPLGVHAAAARAPLHILLTNDDGYAAPGIVAVHAALRAAGYAVTLVAPRENKSGSSVSVSTAPLKYEEVTPGVWAVDGSPADAAAVGLRVVLRGQHTDLVISGANLGQNAGRTANISGTVGAAILAAQFGVPAVAISVGLHLDEKTAQPQPFPSTLASFPGAADFTVALVQQLALGAGTGPLLPPGSLLNVNYPAGRPGPPKGVRLAQHGQLGAFAFDYLPTGKSNEVKLHLAPETASEPQPTQADTALFAAGYVTVTVLDGDWGAPQGLRQELAQRLQPLLSP